MKNTIDELLSIVLGSLIQITTLVFWATYLKDTFLIQVEFFYFILGVSFTLGVLGYRFSIRFLTHRNQTYTR